MQWCLPCFPLNSCEKDDEVNPISTSLLGTETLTDLVVKNGSLSSLETALGAASGDLPGTLSGTEAYTVFAPNDDAFKNLAEQTGFESTAAMLAELSPDLLAKILSYHVVAGESNIADLTDGKKLSAVAGGDLTVTSTADGDKRTVQIIDASKLEQTNPVSSIQGTLDYVSNGIIHIVDKILLSQEVIVALEIDTRPTILDWAKSTEDLSTLVKAIEKAALVDTIMNLEESTVLAPTNEAFTDLLDTLGEDYNSLDDFDNAAEIAFLADVLKYHVISARVGSADLAAGQVETALKDNTVEVVAENGTFTFGDATVTNAAIVTADIDGKNGFVHSIDKVLVPQTALDFLANLDSGDLANVVGRTLQLSKLEEALIATDLIDTFTDNTNESFVKGEDEKDEDFEKRRTPDNFTYFKPATVFAPSDDAFTELLDLLGDDFTSIASFDTEEELALLKEILLYHVVPGKIGSADLTAGNLTTAAGSDIEVLEVFGTSNFTIGNTNKNVIANIDTPDVAARNGVAHIIDKVLLPGSAIIFVKSMNKEEGE